VGDNIPLLERAKKLDLSALATIYDSYAGRVYQYIYHRLGDPGLAEDLTAEVFVRLLQGLKTGHGPHSNLVAWLYRVAHNLIVDYFRRNSRFTVSLDDILLPATDDPPSTVENTLAGEEIRQLIQLLTPDQQQVIYLKFVENLSNAEVGEILGKTEGAIKALQHRALASLRRHLERKRSSVLRRRN